MLINNPQSYLERSKTSDQAGVGDISRAVDILQKENNKEGVFSSESWSALETSLTSFGFSKRDDATTYLSRVALSHGSDVFVRRASMHRFIASMENGTPLSITPMDSEPNVSLLGANALGVGSALESGFGWLVEGKVAGVFGFTNTTSCLNVSSIEKDSVSHTKKAHELMKRVSGELQKDDVLFLLLRIHKSVFPENLLQEDDYDSFGEVNSFIIRLYTKNRHVQ